MATKKSTTKKKTIRKHRGINQRTGKLKKGFKYGANGRIVEVQTPAQKKRQTGSTNVAADKKKRALPPGKRKSASGKTYYERRANRSDKGKLLGLNASVCVRKNGDGSSTTYSPMHGTDCYKGDKLVKATITTASLNGARKKKPTAKQIAARKKFVANVRAGKYKK